MTELPLPSEQRYVRRSGNVKLDFYSADPKGYTRNREGQVVVPFNIQGRSPAFDHTKAGLVIVDPGVPGGGQMLDLRAIPKSQFAKAVEASAGDPERGIEALLALQNTPTAAAAPEPSRAPAPVSAQPAMSLEYNDDAEPQPVSGLPQSAGEPVTQPAAPAALPPALDLDELARRVAALGPLKPQPPGQVPLVGIPSPRSLVELPPAGLIAPASIASPGYKGPQAPINLALAPTRPEIEVLFHLPSIGVWRAYFHHVSATKDLVLYYDTRYDGRAQFLPEESDTPLVIDVPELKRRFLVQSLGLSDSFGPIDIVWLIVEKAETLS